MSLWIVHLAKHFLDSKLLLSIWYWEGREGGERDEIDCKAACQLSCYEGAKQREQSMKNVLNYQKHRTDL